MRYFILALAVLLAGCCDEQACTDAEYQALDQVILTRPYQPAPSAVFVGCTRTGAMVNCIGQ